MSPSGMRVLASTIEAALSDVDRLVEWASDAFARLETAPEDAFVAYGAGAVAHAFYTELEKVFERVAKEFDGFRPRGESWHTELLDQKALELPGIRPRVLDGDLRDQAASPRRDCEAHCSGRFLHPRGASWRPQEFERKGHPRRVD